MSADRQEVCRYDESTANPTSWNSYILEPGHIGACIAGISTRDWGDTDQGISLRRYEQAAYSSGVIHKSVHPTTHVSRSNLLGHWSNAIPIPPFSWSPTGTGTSTELHYRGMQERNTGLRVDSQSIGFVDKECTGPLETCVRM